MKMRTQKKTNLRKKKMILKKKNMTWKSTSRKMRMSQSLNILMKRWILLTLCHLLLSEKGKVKEKYYDKLILDMGNEVRLSVEQGTVVMEKLVEELGSAEDKTAPLTQAAIRRMIKESVDAAIAAERARQANAGNDARGSGPVRGQDAAPAVRECTFAGFIKINPTAFHGTGGVVELRRWFKKTKSVFRISECAEGNKFHKCEKVGHKARYCKEKNLAMGANALPFLTCYDCGEQGHTRNRCLKCNTPKMGRIGIKQVGLREVHGQAYAIKDAKPKGPNVVTSTFLLNNRYAFDLFDLGSDRSFMDTSFGSMLNIDPVKIRASYEVELADGRVVSTNIVLKGCTLNLVNHIFEIDLVPIELGTFDVIIGMDWLVRHDTVIVCGEKVVRIPYGNKMLIVKSDKGVSRLKSNLKEKRMEDVPVIHDFPEVFPKEFPGLPPPRLHSVEIVTHLLLSI
nr:hypothetical protein [Tanacetum cinerariifolium]